MITDANGNEATRLQYLPFGELDQARSNGGYVSTHDFTGQERDPEAGLLYYHARTYDPALGRVLTPDSIIPDLRDSQPPHPLPRPRRSKPVRHTRHPLDCAAKIVHPTTL